MDKYHPGQKIFQERIQDLQNELDALKSTTLVYGSEEVETYGKCLAALRYAYAKGEADFQPLFFKADGSSIARPLTFEETIDAIVNDYESKNKELLNKWNGSCTGIAYKANTSRFKVVPVSQDLILLSEDFKSPYFSVCYDNQDGMELDKIKGKYNVKLTKSEVLENPGWLAAVRDKALLKAFRDIVFAELELKTDTAMSFNLGSKQQQDHLRMLSISCINLNSQAYDWSLLNLDVRFVRVSSK